MGSLRVTNSTAQLIVELAIAAFFAALFLQSGLDKVIDSKGNRAYLNDVFAKTPFRPAVPQLFLAITVLELSAGLISLLGFLQLVFARQSVLAFWGAVLAVIALWSLFLGQRLARDYGGAAALVPYFLVGIAGMYILR